MVVGDLRTLNENDRRERRTKNENRALEYDRRGILIVYSEKQAVVSTVMCAHVETKRKETVPDFGFVLESTVQV